MRILHPMRAGAFLTCVVFSTALHADSLLVVTVSTEGLEWHNTADAGGISIALSGLDYSAELDANTPLSLEINPFVFTIGSLESPDQVHPGELVRSITLNGVSHSLSQAFNLSGRDKDTLHIHGYESLAPLVFGLGAQGEIFVTALSTKIVGSAQGAAGTIMATFLWAQPVQPLVEAPEPVALVLVGFGLVALGFMRRATLRRAARRSALLRTASRGKAAPMHSSPPSD